MTCPCQCGEEDRKRAAEALREKARRCLDIAQHDGRNVSAQTRRPLRCEASECEELAAQIGRPKETTTFRSAR